jgi:hypothetical protein
MFQRNAPLRRSERDVWEEETAVPRWLAASFSHAESEDASAQHHER